MVHRPEKQLMPLVPGAGLLILLLATGCAGMDRAAQDEPPAAGAVQEKAPALEPQKPALPVAAEPAPPAAAAPPPSPPPVARAAAKPATVAAKPEAPAAKPQASAEKPPAKAPASPAPKAPAPKKESAVPPAPRPAAPTLDLTALETRLKETGAIGVFTKLTLKNQVDDLLNRFRAYYQGRAKTTLAELRQPYDLLILKVLTLLQDGDPSLAGAIRASREAIWAILTDREKFSKLAS